MLIEMRREPMQGNEGLFYTFYLPMGVKIPRSFTPETDAAQVAKFHALLNEHINMISGLVSEYYKCIVWNNNHRGQGKNWPIFSKVEKLLNKWQKEAGIVDT